MSDNNNTTDGSALVHYPSPRVRAFPHESNQYSVHVFVKLDDDCEDICRELTEQLTNEFPAVETAIASRQHVSLINGYFILRLHQIHAFGHALRHQLSQCQAFTLVLSRVNLWSNQQNTRLFVTISECTPTHNTTRLLSAVTRALNQFPLGRTRGHIQDHEYTCHTSVASLATEHASEGQAFAAEVDARLKDVLLSTRVRKVCLKVGNELQFISLQ